MDIQALKNYLNRYWTLNVFLFLVAGFLFYVSITRGNFVLACMTGFIILVEIVILLFPEMGLRVLDKSDHDYPLNLRLTNYIRVNYPRLIFLILLLYALIIESDERLLRFSLLSHFWLNILIISSYVFAVVMGLRKRKKK